VDCYELGFLQRLLNALIVIRQLSVLGMRLVVVVHCHLRYDSDILGNIQRTIVGTHLLVMTTLEHNEVVPIDDLDALALQD